VGRGGAEPEVGQLWPMGPLCGPSQASQLLQVAGWGQGLMLVRYGQGGRFAAHRRQASSYRWRGWAGLDVGQLWPMGPLCGPSQASQLLQVRCMAWYLGLEAWLAVVSQPIATVARPANLPLVTAFARDASQAPAHCTRRTRSMRRSAACCATPPTPGYVARRG